MVTGRATLDTSLGPIIRSSPRQSANAVGVSNNHPGHCMTHTRFNLVWQFSSHTWFSMLSVDGAKWLRLTRVWDSNCFPSPPLGRTLPPWVAGLVVLAIESALGAWASKNHLSLVTAATPKGFHRSLATRKASTIHRSQAPRRWDYSVRHRHHLLVKVKKVCQMNTAI